MKANLKTEDFCSLYLNERMASESVSSQSINLWCAASTL